MTTRTSNGILVRGFQDIKSDSNPSGKLQWYCAPPAAATGTTDDKDVTSRPEGAWRITEKAELEIAPPAKRDFWRKTYYDPVLVKDDGPILYCPLKYDDQKHYTIETAFTLTARQQFDQAGIFLRLDAEHWIKTGIEVVDQRPRLSCVVTNVYSDWSTQPWNNSSVLRRPGKDSSDAVVVVECRIRVHCRGTSFVVEVKNKAKGANNEWEFIRIAHVHRDMTLEKDPLASHPSVTSSWQGPSPPQGELWVGVFACCPTDQQGGRATFSFLEIKEGSTFEHKA